jgi:hypothetical protein
MDHPADDIDLAVAASYAHGYMRALIAFTEQLERAAPPGVHRAAATLAAWILKLDPDDERLKRAPRLLADGDWRQLRVDKALEEVVWRLESPACADQFAAVVPGLRDALAAVCRIIGVTEPPARPTGGAWQPLDPEQDALLLSCPRQDRPTTRCSTSFSATSRIAAATLRSRSPHRWSAGLVRIRRQYRWAVGSASSAVITDCNERQARRGAWRLVRNRPRQRQGVVTRSGSSRSAGPPSAPRRHGEHPGQEGT